MSILQLEGAYENELATSGEFNPQAPRTALMLPSGQRVVLPTEVLLQALGGGSAPKPKHAGEMLAEDRNAVSSPAISLGAEQGSDTVVPLVAEQLHVGKTEVETARVKVRRETEEYTERVSVPLTDVRWEVEHVSMEKAVDSEPEVRQVGDTIIFPMVEERLVVKRELWLREEVHVRKVSTTVEKSAEFPLKRDVIVQERTALPSTSSDT